MRRQTLCRLFYRPVSRLLHNKNYILYPTPRQLIKYHDQTICNIFDFRGFSGLVFKQFNPTSNFPGPELHTLWWFCLYTQPLGDEISFSRGRVIIILYNLFNRDADDLLLCNNIVIVSARRTRSRARTSFLSGTPSTVAAAVYPSPPSPSPSSPTSQARRDITLDTCRRTTASG